MAAASASNLKAEYPFYLGGRAVAPNHDLPVTNKYTQRVEARVAVADRAAIDRAIAMAVEAAGPMRRLPTHRRRAILEHVVQTLQQRGDELARVLAVEAGKPIIHSRGEVERCIDTFRIAMEECSRLNGRAIRLDITPRAEGYEGIWKRVPVGPCSFITPFNFPLNLAAHKIGPALAVGCPFILKPDPRTPITSIILGEILAGTELPPGAFSILPNTGDGIELFSEDERIKLLSFTGSPRVGWMLKSKAGRKKVVLELGGNAACIVDEGADPAFASERIAFGAFYQSGQSCISVQRILAHRALYDDLKARLIKKAAALKAGDPLDESTFLGPMISEDEAKRVEAWVNEAVKAGAKLLVGGKRNGSFYSATMLENVDPRMKVSCQEVFGPVATLAPFDEFDDALRFVNDSDYGLQAGVFTPSLDHAFRAFDELEVGGVIVNDVPSMRVDNMPYGGVKMSGLGREGVRFAMEDMTEIRLMVLNRAAE